jgi:biopolymer transport protein ExbD
LSGPRFCLLAALATACAREPAKQAAVVPLPTVQATAPATVPAEPVDLPRASDFDHVVAVFTVDVAKDGSLTANGRPVKDEAELADLARRAARKSPDLRAVIRADRSVAYRQIIAVMDALRRGGISRLAFAVAPTAP